MSTAPAAAFRLPGGTLQPGRAADVVVLDVTARWTVDPAAFFSKSRNTPFAGWALIGRAAITIVDGNVVHQAEAHAGSRRRMRSPAPWRGAAGSQRRGAPAPD